MQPVHRLRECCGSIVTIQHLAQQQHHEFDSSTDDTIEVLDLIQRGMETHDAATSTLPLWYTASLEDLHILFALLKAGAPDLPTPLLAHHLQGLHSAIAGLPARQRDLCSTINNLNADVLEVERPTPSMQHRVPHWLPQARSGCIPGSARLCQRIKEPNDAEVSPTLTKRPRVEPHVTFLGGGDLPEGKPRASSLVGASTAVTSTSPPTERGPAVSTCDPSSQHQRAHSFQAGAAVSLPRQQDVADVGVPAVSGVPAETSVASPSTDAQPASDTTSAATDPIGSLPTRAHEVSRLMQVLGPDAPPIPDWPQLQLDLEQVAQLPDAASLLAPLRAIGEQALLRLCGHLLNEDCSYQATHLALASTLLPHLRSLDMPSRSLVEACNLAAGSHGKALLEAVLQPLVSGKQLNPAQAQLLGKVVNERMPPPLRRELFVAMLGGRGVSGAPVCWSEGHLSLLQALLDKKVEVKQDDLESFIACVQKSCETVGGNAALLKVVLTMVNQHGRKFGKPLAMKLHGAVSRTKTFLTKCVLSRLDKL